MRPSSTAKKATPRDAASKLAQLRLSVLDPCLRLPGHAENFDTRLILLRRRLEERAAPIQLDRCGRGRFHLTLTASPELIEAAPEVEG